LRESLRKVRVNSRVRLLKICPNIDRSRSIDVCDYNMWACVCVYMYIYINIYVYIYIYIYIYV
jgi:hypothetical protein